LASQAGKLRKFLQIGSFCYMFSKNRRVKHNPETCDVQYHLFAVDIHRYPSPERVQEAVASKVSELEKRVRLIEQELRDLKEQVDRKRELPWYRQILGQFKDDPAFDEIVRLGRQIRESQRKRTR
jgi:hypothetical protein